MSTEATAIGMAKESRQQVAMLLNTLLADEFVVYVKTKKFHWNIQGPHFNDLHKFFEKQYRELDEMADSVAERVRKLGHFAIGTMDQFLRETNMLEHSDDGTKDTDLVKKLLDDHETLIRTIREHIDTVQEKYKDAGTADFLTQLIEKHETMAWMLRAFIA